MRHTRSLGVVPGTKDAGKQLVQRGAKGSGGDSECGPIKGHDTDVVGAGDADTGTLLKPGPGGSIPTALSYDMRISFLSTGTGGMPAGAADRVAGYRFFDIRIQARSARTYLPVHGIPELAAARQVGWQEARLGRPAVDAPDT